MSEPIKLKLAGEKHTLTVKRVRLLPFGNDPEIEYEGTDGSKVWVPQKSSDRQLARLNLTEETVVGRRITIKRDANSTKGRPPFWGIYLEDGESGAKNGNGSGPASAGKAGASTSGGAVASSLPPQPPAPSPAKDQGASGYKLYRQITEKVLADIVPLYAEHGVTPDASAVHSIVATLYISAQKGH